jgi:hypothetical protein
MVIMFGLKLVQQVTQHLRQIILLKNFRANDIEA